MIIKCRDIDKDIAATSQRLLQGGIRIRDWFSDKLHTHTKVMQDTCTEKKHRYQDIKPQVPNSSHGVPSADPFECFPCSNTPTSITV